MRLALIIVAAFLQVSCASAPPKIDEGGAISAARDFVASKPWAPQATYTAKYQHGDWTVVVSCNKCHNPDGTPVSAEYVLAVDRYGKATFIIGLQ